MKKQSNLSRLIAYAGKYRVLIVLGCVLSAVAAVIGLLPYICIWLIARDILSEYPAITISQSVFHLGWLSVWFAIANIAIYFIALMCTHIAAFRTARNIRYIGVEHVLNLPLGFFTSSQSGRLRKIIDDNASLTEDILAHKLADLTGSIVMPIAAIALLFIFDWRMGVMCLISMALSVIFVMSMMSGKNAGFFHRYQQEIEKMSASAVEYVRGIPVVKVFQQTVYSFKAFYAAIRSYGKLASDYAMSCRTGQTAFLTCIHGTFVLLIPTAILIASHSNVQDVLINFIFYSLFAPACGAMINKVMYMSESVMEANEAMKGLDKLLSQKPLAECDKAVSSKGNSIEFESVVFAYPDANRNAVDNVSFKVEEGSVVALVGPSGGGKSTIASLIPRFWDVQQGCIRIGGVDVRSMDSRKLMDKISFVFQDTKLLKLSVLENIRLARPGASVTEVKKAAKEAQCEDLIAKLPKRFDTVIGEKGVYLSGGEAQRIAIARAILKDSPIIVLDEATAFADPENEALIQQALSRLVKGKTVLMIAHRLSTIKDADNIFVIDNGRLVEEGSHEKLVKNNGLYSKMWADYQKAVQWKVGKEAII